MKDFGVYIDLNTQYTWIVEGYLKDYIPESNKIIKDNISIIARNVTLTGKCIIDELYLNWNANVSEILPFYFIQNIPDRYSFRGSLAFPFKFLDNQVSIVHTYYSKGYIDTLAFGMRRESDKRKLLRIGGLPNEDKENKMHSYIDVIGKDGHWDCIISKVALKKGRSEVIYNMNKTNSYAFFDTVKETIDVPIDFFDLIISQYEEEVKQNDCSIALKYETKQRKLVCMEHKLIDMGTISFEIGKYRYTLSLSKLWFCEDDNYCDLLIEENTIPNQWKLGLIFLNKNNILFDYTEAKIHFYASDNMIEEIASLQKIKQSIMIPISNICILMMGIVLNVITLK